MISFFTPTILNVIYFHTVWNVYQAGQFAMAASLFPTSLLQQFPATTLSQILFQRCLEFQRNQPYPAYNGVVTLSFK